MTMHALFLLSNITQGCQVLMLIHTMRFDVFVTYENSKTVGLSEPLLFAHVFSTIG